MRLDFRGPIRSFTLDDISNNSTNSTTPDTFSSVDPIPKIFYATVFAVFGVIFGVGTVYYFKEKKIAKGYAALCLTGISVALGCTTIFSNYIV